MVLFYVQIELQGHPKVKKKVYVIKKNYKDVFQRKIGKQMMIDQENNEAIGIWSGRISIENCTNNINNMGINRLQNLSQSFKLTMLKKSNKI